MEAPNAKYTDLRSEPLALPNETSLTPSEMQATRGMVIYDRIEKTEQQEEIDSKKWNDLAKKKPLKRGLAQKK